MLIDTIFFLLGFIFLIKGADLLVDGSSSIAKKYGISNFVIGLTIVAFGTSMPELLVSTLASFKGSAGVALGNIIGSNISNTLLILGISAVIRPLLVKKNTVNKEIPFSLLAVLAVGFLVNDKIIDGFQSSILTRIDGFVLILFFVIFIYYTFGISKDESTILESISEEKIETYKFYHSAALIMAGLVGLYFGGEWIVGSAINFAKIFNISETSLPELAASAVAAYRGKTDIAVGNVVGSNIFNILWVLGISSVIAPIPFSTILNVDFFILFAVTILLLFLIFVGKRNILGRVEGSFSIFLYIIYLIFIIFRG